MKKAFLVLGYNNTRIDDVRKIRAKAKEGFDAVTVLCKPNLTPDDIASVDHAVDVSLDPNPANATRLLKEVQNLGLKIIGVLPFSDPGTQLAAFVCRELRLPGADPSKVSAALSKVDFRVAESRQATHPLRYRAVRFEKISSKEELVRFFESSPQGAFVKPAQEGNSRGCTVVRTMADVDRAWTELAPYLAGGIIVEENVTGGQEYSFDHVFGKSWITEKQTTQNAYRAEIQQIVPAPLESSVYDTLSTAGRHIAEIAGSEGGACHNELFWVAGYGEAVAVEPNLRPGGMKIWDLAALAFESLDPWMEWLRWASATPVGSSTTLSRKKFAGIRMISAPRDGKLECIPTLDLASLRADYPGLLEVRWTKAAGASVTTDPKDNSGFVGFIIAAHPDYKVLSRTLVELSKALSEAL